MQYPEPIIALLAGFLLDLFLGDPRWLPHPIRLFGKIIAFGEKNLNKCKHRKLKGAILTILLVLSTFLSFWGMLKLITDYKILHLILTSIFVFYGIANHSLIKESILVIHKLNKFGIDAGRKQLSMIVGRDTKNLNENQIRIAVLETLSENLSDGVVAPLFFYFIGGVPAMFAYKMTNTLDSMIGYKNERYKDFGWFAAKLDDVLNFVPARLTAFLMVALTFSWRGLKFIFKYARKHSSPNSGFPEAALSGILNCRFGGPNFYKGKLVEKPFIGENHRTVFNRDIYKACAINVVTSVVLVAIFMIVLVTA